QPVPFAGRPGGPSNGLLGSEALLNYRVGIDYAHSTVYFDIGRLFDGPDVDVVGLFLRPENDGQFTILGVADYEGKPSVPEGNDGVQAGDHLIAVDGIPVRGSTLGQVWAMLAGSPGTKRMLTVERAGGQVTVGAQVQHFLGDAPLESQTKKRSKKKN
ncbi:MAG: PDZ domain-containing protein, partial [Candidatus Sulfotelmatobacter sp.]